MISTYVVILLAVVAYGCGLGVHAVASRTDGGFWAGLLAEVCTFGAVLVFGLVVSASPQPQEGPTAAAVTCPRGRRREAVRSADCCRRGYHLGAASGEPRGRRQRLPARVLEDARRGTVMSQAQYVERLEPGDLILTTLPTKTKEAEYIPSRLVSSIYTKFSPTLQGPFAHAAMYVGDGKVVEALGHGVVSRNVRATTRNRGFVVMRPSVPPDVRRQAAHVAKQQVGKKYDVQSAGVAGIGLVLPDLALRGLRRSLTADVKEQDRVNAFQCSGLVAYSYMEAGAPISGDLGWKYTSPAELADSKRFPVVMSRLSPEALATLPSRSASRAYSTVADTLEAITRSTQKGVSNVVRVVAPIDGKRRRSSH